jgi:hypothetical protein
MSQRVSRLPDPTPEAVTIWLKRLSRTHLHDEGWTAVNKRFHGLARAARPFINERFETPEEQEAAFDGLTLALLAMGHFQDITQLADLFNHQTLPNKHGASEPKPELPKKA